jgi:3-hydroxyisobutyrate dehydrogenase-like beta-hydroxyacid dehydrogenase
VKPVVAIVSPGVMGASLAARLVASGIEVLTTVEGRGPSTAERARAAGMTAVDKPGLLRADILLSVVPPAEAQNTARDIASLYGNAARKPLYVDCNAINPGSVRQIAAMVEGAGGGFVDGSIIGMPAREGYAGPALLLSGPEAAKAEVLSAHGIQTRLLDGPVGAASAVKMAYGGITKGLIAIGSAMMLGATRAGVAGDLRAEMGRSQANLLAGFARSVPDMFPKAGRWVAEMEEIAQFLGADTPQGRMFSQIADLYAHLASAEGEPDIAALQDFFAE